VNEPKPRPVAPEVPPELDDRAKYYWDQLQNTLIRLGLLTEVDGHTFAVLCQLRSQMHEILMLTQNKPLTATKLKTYKEFRMLSQQFRAYASDLGLSPRGRVGLSVAGTDLGDGEDLLTSG
jgi:P27 family predicted phage terminase small subunit